MSDQTLPGWIEEALARSLDVVNRKLCNGVQPSAGASACLCCGQSAEVLIERSAHGQAALAAHAARVEQLFLRFALAVPSLADYADVFMRVVVPTHNAVHNDSRRCIVCGEVFALRSTDADAARYCSDECATRVRKAGRAKRLRTM